MQTFKNWGKIKEKVIRFIFQTNPMLIFEPRIAAQNFIKKELKLRM